MCGNSPGGYFHTFFIYKALAHFGGSKYDIQYSLGFWENNYVVGYEDFVVKFGAYNKTGLFLQVISIHIFYMVNVQSGTIFGVC